MGADVAATGNDTGDYRVPDVDAVVRGLTPEQHTAVTTEASPLCVIAGAGSGKTRVLTRRVAYRVATGSAQADRSVVVTFTRKAAGELRRRLRHLHVDEVTVGTFHSLALSLQRQHWSDRNQAPPGIVDDPARLVRSILDTDHIGSTPRAASVPGGPARPQPDGAFIRALTSEIEWAQACDLRPDTYAAAALAARREPPMAVGAVADVYQRYQLIKHRRRVVDLHDLVTGATRILEHDQATAQALHWRRRHFYVDEFQDVNPAQWHFLLALLGEQRDAFMVGDPHQAIYSWNGSDPTLMARIADLLPGTTVLTLAANHRSTPQIVAAAHAVLDPARPPTTTPRSPQPSPVPTTCPDGPPPAIHGFDDTADEAAAVARWLRLQHHPGRPWSHLAVLARTRARLGPVAEALTRAGIPHRQVHPAADDDTTSLVGDSTERAVTLATMHQAKGLEWPAVALVGLEDGLVPSTYARSPQARAEECRLLYVAVTRAETDLWCSWARDRSALGLTGPASGSPWLAAIEAAIVDTPTPAPATVIERLHQLRTQLAG